MSDISPQEFGRMQSEVENLRESVDKLETAVEKLTLAISEMTGGKKLLLGLAAIVASATGVITWLASHIKYSP